MVSRDLSGDTVVTVLVDVGSQRTTGSHVVLKWYPPEHHGQDRQCSPPRLDAGTLRKIATQAGAEDFDCAWIDRNR